MTNQSDKAESLKLGIKELREGGTGAAHPRWGHRRGSTTGGPPEGGAGARGRRGRWPRTRSSPAGTAHTASSAGCGRRKAGIDDDPRTVRRLGGGFALGGVFVLVVKITQRVKG